MVSQSGFSEPCSLSGTVAPGRWHLPGGGEQRVARVQEEQGGAPDRQRAQLQHDLREREHVVPAGGDTGSTDTTGSSLMF